MVELSENETQDVDGQEHVKLVLKGATLMSWTIKAHPFPMLLLDAVMAIGTLFPIGLLIYSYVGEFTNDVEIYWRVLGFFGILIWLFLWLRGARQKTVYKYRITDQGGELEYWEDYPENMGAFFKWLSGISLFIVICLIAVDPAFVWGLAGPLGIAVTGAKFFLKWENKKKYNWFFWDDFDHVIIDRKRNVVVFLDHPLVFEAFVEKNKIDRYLETIRTYMSSNTRYVEGNWKN
ncbi:hypothetical protein [Pseudomonas sp. NA-150]|uniref:hypothetical protein n=1 Tax=Pseudomonas sp. NA-150 TaxID=3367525 RepID=UPI0037C6FA5A